MKEQRFINLVSDMSARLNVPASAVLADLAVLVISDKDTKARHDFMLTLIKACESEDIHIWAHGISTNEECAIRVYKVYII
jgi:uncharacterized protein YcgI (DUF1989 family)